MKKQAKEKERSRPTKLFTFHSSFFTGKSRKEGEERKDKNEERREQKEKATLRATFSFWWGMVDSNHRRRCQQIYSLSPLATREIPHMKFVEDGAGRRTRTPDLLITNQLLYQLSYTSTTTSENYATIKTGLCQQKSFVNPHFL